MERLDKIIALQLGISRNDVKSLLKKGAVTVNGEAAKNGSLKVQPQDDAIFVNGERIIFKKHIYIMMNKPSGVVSASEDGKERTVVDLVPKSLYRKGLFPAGRLDKDTTGFSLITDDGEFAHKILSPKNHIYKTYLARLKCPLSRESIERLQNGITLCDGTTLKESRVNIIENSETPLVEIIICEGKYHQVKRMFAATGNRVVSLHRTKMGGLSLDDTLKFGECREITESELKKITEK